MGDPVFTLGSILQDEESEAVLEADLHGVLSGSLQPQFRFQPIADLRRGVVAGYEALLRLPTRAALAPNLCLQAAGRFGIQIELEALVARLALAARDRLPANSFLSLNVSPLFLLSAAWQEVLTAFRDLHRVVVEITEEQSIQDYDRVRARVAEIRARGGMIAIDDAGAGYASFRHILELRPAFIKLDRDFIRQCHTDRAKSALIEMMGSTASRMDAWIIAEGVETAGELAELLRLGVPLAQGYYLGRPELAMTSLLPRARHELEAGQLRSLAEQDLLLQAEECLIATSSCDAAELLASRPEESVVVITDQWQRPMALLERHPLLGIRLLQELMLCQASTELAQVLQRALTRPLAERYDPVVLIAGDGRLLGVAQVDRLMQAALHGTGSHQAPRPRPSHVPPSPVPQVGPSI